MSAVVIPPLWLHVLAGAVCFFLGMAFCLRSASITREFKLVVIAHRRILLMALVSQGILLCFIGVLIIVARLVSPETPLSRAFSFSCAVLLLLFSVWTGSTGARSELVLLRFSHFVTIAAAGLVLLGMAQG